MPMWLWRVHALGRVGGEMNRMDSKGKEMNKPTKEQITEFWEWCGFTDINGHPQFGFTGRKSGSDKYSNLNIGLNSLFRYAVPKLDYALIDYKKKPRPLYKKLPSCQAYVGIKEVGHFSSYAETPALALFWAIERLRGKE